jgi:hypothetical protein
MATEEESDEEANSSSGVNRVVIDRTEWAEIDRTEIHGTSDESEGNRK